MNSESPLDQYTAIICFLSLTCRLTNVGADVAVYTCRMQDLVDRLTKAQERIQAILERL